MKTPLLRLHQNHNLIVDNFAGGGGASLGIEWALGRSPDIAVNHDPEAIALHKANHPHTRHLCGDVWDVNPAKLCGGQRVSLAWFSPDCKHFSRAKGGKPVEKKIRGLAWVVIRWAKAVKPRVIVLENVEEFADWGPLTPDDRPCPDRKGLTFRRWLGKLKAQGYEVEMRLLRACDYGAPTIRKRLFIIARCDGRPIVWPEVTHSPEHWRTAAECIQWELPCPSIFERTKPLAEKTLARIARGVMRYVVDAGEPFLVPVTHAGDRRVHALGEPFRTITGAKRGEIAYVSPTLVQTGYGERPGQAPRALDLHRPMGTVVGCGVKQALVSAFLAKHYGGHEATGSALPEPVSTITAKDHHALVAANLVKLYGTCADGQRIEQPLPTIRAGGTHLGEVRAFLIKYYGQSIADDLKRPLGTVTARDRFGLVTVRGEQYEIADIGMRMLQPRELFRGQGFPDSYQIDALVDGKPLSKTAQVKLCGNSVPPQFAAAIVRANATSALRATA